MRKIFISYRRTEAEYAAGALFRELRKRFGEEQVFRDKEDIGGGESWKKKVLAEIDNRSALLVFIGCDWAGTRDAQGQRRLDNPDDPLRLELLDGLKDGAAIIPILLENAQMPNAAELPQELHVLAELNALRLRDSDWQHDLEKLFRTLEKVGFQPIASQSSIAQRAVVDAKAALTAAQAKPRGAPIKLVISFVLTGLLLIALAGDNDAETHWGLAAFGIGSIVLAVMSYRDFQHHRSSVAWPAIVAMVLAVITSLAHVGNAGLAQAREHSGGGGILPPMTTYSAPLNLVGQWVDSNGIYSDFYQQGEQVQTVTIVGGYRWDGLGRLSGNSFVLNISVNGVMYATLNAVVSPDGRQMSGTLSSNLGTSPITYARL